MFGMQKSSVQIIYYLLGSLIISIKMAEAKNLTSITWAHAVNNQELLRENLKNNVMRLEADIVIGTLINSSSSELIPIMGHPPQNTSDLSLEEFLRTINDHNSNPENLSKGVKLDFKSMEAFQKAANDLNNYKNVSYSLWLNADIVRGPLLAGDPVNATNFLNLAKTFPASTLSIGWTTRYGGLIKYTTYSDEQINSMLSIISEMQIIQPITFPVRAGIAAESFQQMSKLIETVANATLTIWSSQDDYVEVEKLRNVIRMAGLDRVYVDVPESLRSQLHLDQL